MKKKRLIIWGSVAVLVAVAVIVIVNANRPEVVFNTRQVATGTVETTVMATGYIQPVEEIEVGTQVSGVIEKIYVDYNSHVTKGQLLAELDKSTLEEKLSQAKASLASAKSDLLYSQQNYDRVKRLHDAKAATDVALEEAVNRLEQARTSLENAQSNANQAIVNRDYAYIYSPIDGVVLDRSVNVGQTVAASFNTPTLFTIAEDLTKMQVEVDVDEADIGQIRIGQKASFTVDSYNGEYFEGTVQQIRLQPTVTSNVVTYTVIVEAPNPDEKLFPGMTANITIQVQSETGLTVPLEAANFRITEEIADKMDVPDRSLVTPARAQSMGRPSASSSVQTAGKRTVWVREGDRIEPRTIETGLDDGINIIVHTGLREGEEVVLSAHIGKKSKNSSTATRNPLMPGGRR